MRDFAFIAFLGIASGVAPVVWMWIRGRYAADVPQQSPLPSVFDPALDGWRPATAKELAEEAAERRRRDDQSFRIMAIAWAVAAGWLLASAILDYNDMLAAEQARAEAVEQAQGDVEVVP